MALQLMREHGLEGRFSFRFDRARRRTGSCQLTPRGAFITLSIHFVELNPPEVVRLTLLHEVAHALVGPQQGHGPQWRQTCLAIGGDGKTQSEAEMPTGDWWARCEACQSEHNLVRRPKELSGWKCSCGDELNWKKSVASHHSNNKTSITEQPTAWKGILAGEKGHAGFVPARHNTQE